jgi:secreted Zn-dependent insulinase-like peptidase
VVQSPWASADEIERRIEGWLMEYLNAELEGMSERTFQDVRAALIAIKTEKPAALFDETSRYTHTLSKRESN